MSVLVDTSIWAEHIRRGDQRLARLLGAGEVATHEYIIGELTLGFVRRSGRFMTEVGDLVLIERARHEEVLAFVASHRLEGSGIDWVDAHLLTSAKIAGTDLWTADRAMLRAAAKAGVRT